MVFDVRPGSVNEAVAAARSVPELTRPVSEASIAVKLQGKPHLVLVALADEPLGFKIGYQLNPYTFYSWLGGVAPSARRQGLAQQLLEAQETWARGRGYLRLRVKSSERFPGMLALLAKNNYVFDGREADDLGASGKMLFVKSL